jgi:hypothetical protein
VTTTVVQAYRFALDPTPTQDAALRSHCGGQRYAFNSGLALVRAVMDQRTAEVSYGIGADQLTPVVVVVGVQPAELPTISETLPARRGHSLVLPVITRTKGSDELDCHRNLV